VTGSFAVLLVTAAVQAAVVLGTLLQRGRREGAFRADLPTDWLVATFYGILHGAAAEITAGRLDPDGAAEVITATLLAAFTPPPGPAAAAR
jgi:TetR/AcrR family transcriptional repressor of mexCD-oprJ operon